MQKRVTPSDLRSITRQHSIICRSTPMSFTTRISTSWKADPKENNIASWIRQPLECSNMSLIGTKASSWNLNMSLPTIPSTISILFAIENGSCDSTSKRPNDDHYSDRRLCTGFVKAALIAWKLMVKSAIAKAPTPASTNIHHAE